MINENGQIVMEIEKKTDNKAATMMDKRMQRRRLLRTGALAAPIAMTLHGGVPLAHADSSGSCVFELIDIANNPSHPRWGELQVPINSNSGHVAHTAHGHDVEPDAGDYPPGTVLMPFDASDEHWEFISSASNRFGFSCVASVTNIKIKGNNGFGNLDQTCPGGSCDNNGAENDFTAPSNNPHSGTPN